MLLRKKMLLVPHEDWGNDSTQQVRMLLAVTAVDLSVGRSLEMIPGQDYVLIMVGDGPYEPALLREVGARSREHGVEIHYVPARTFTIAAKINKMIETPTTEPRDLVSYIMAAASAITSKITQVGQTLRMEAARG